MAEIDTIPESLHDNHSTHHDDTTDAEHEDSGDQVESPEASNDDLNLDELPPAHVESAGFTEAIGEEVPVKVVRPKEDAGAKKTVSMSVIPPKKVNGGPPTPTVKKIINSGTFGTGSVKPAGTKPSTSGPSAAKTIAPVMRKAASTAPPTSKPASSVSIKPSVAPTTTARRASVVTTRVGAPPPVRSPLSASTSAKPSDGTAARSAVASPTGSVASASAKGKPAISSGRPHASVSEAVKKASLTPRPSVASSAKAPVPARTSTMSRSSVAPPAKSSRTTGSISSIREVKEDTKALDDLRAQLAEATQSLESKNERVLELESQIETLGQTLASKLTEIESRDASIAESEQANKDAESQLKDAQNTLSNVQKQMQELTSALQSVQEELETANSKVSSQSSLIEKLEERIQELEDNISSFERKIEVLEQEQALSTTSASEETSIEHEALLTAQANLKAISEEVDALKVVHTKAMQDSESQISELRQQLATTETLQAQVTSLKAEKEENANKLSELEVEILELKEAQDSLEDAKHTLQKQVANLEDELAKAAVAAALAAESVSQKDASHEQELTQLVERHESELKADSERYNEIVSSLETLKSDLLEAVTAKEQVEKDILAKEDHHTSKIGELEGIHAAQRASLAADIDRITQELQSQESLYNSKVEAVKNEHAQLLQDAYERAKDEAAKAHSEELKVFRANGDVTVLQLQKANQEAIDTLKSDHQSLLETEVNALQKKINNLSLELKATQDDLSKAKSYVEASHAEIENLTQQRDAARSQAETASSLSPEHANEISRLTKDLSNTKDDLAAMTDMLNLTKSSMAELSDTHSRDLEQAAKSRADEVLKLRDAHDVEVNTLARQKSDLLVRLSDLEGELATAKATLEARQISSPKNSGNGIIPSSTSGITKEELIKMHEAHNLKVYDLQAEHEKAIKLARDEVEAALVKVGELQQDIARKAMEIQYLEQDQDESAEQITRLKEDLERLGQVESKS